MSLPASIASTIDRDGIIYRLHAHRPVRSLEEAARECDIPLAHLVRGVLLEDRHGVMLVVLPLNHSIDFAALKRITGRELQPARHAESARFFLDCEPGSIPPLARPYQINAVVDNALLTLPQVCFEPGDRRILVCMESEDFIRLHGKSQFATFSQPLTNLTAPDPASFVNVRGSEKLQQLRPLGNIADRMSHLKSLPAIPETVEALLHLRTLGETSSDELVELIARDASLAAQLIRQARAMRRNPQEKIETLEQAISNGLGFELALNLALGAAVSHHFRIAAEGPLGLNAFWRHAIFSASLAEALAQLLPARLGIASGTAYLAGLLHNIGYLVMGEMLQAEFYLLNKVIDANPEVPITLVEKRLLGIGHTHIGGWLMRNWQIPDEVITAVREHHNELYRGSHSHYVHLMIVVDCLLKSYGIGDGPSRSIPPTSLNLLGLDLRRATEAVEHLIDQAEGLNGIAHQLCA